MSKNYEKLALKYKLKCMKLEKEISLLQRGGDGEEKEEEKEESKQEFTIPNWYEQFSQQLTPIYNVVKENYGNNVVLTGSAAITLTLHNLDMIEELNEFQPDDADFLYKIIDDDDDGSNRKKRKNVNLNIRNPDDITVNISNTDVKYTLKEGQKCEKSVTFNIPEPLNDSNDYYFKKFDVTFDKFCNNFSQVRGINVLNIERLKPYYEDVYNESGDEKIKTKAKIKLDIIDKIMERQGKGQEIELEETKLPGPGRGLFNDDSDYESDNEEKSSGRNLFGEDSDNEEKPSGKNLFGDDSDDESMNKKSFAKKEQFIKIKYE